MFLSSRKNYSKKLTWTHSSLTIFFKSKKQKSMTDLKVKKGTKAENLWSLYIIHLKHSSASELCLI